MDAYMARRLTAVSLVGLTSWILARPSPTKKVVAAAPHKRNHFYERICMIV